MSSANIPAARDLARDETLLWSGVPRQGLMLRRNDVFMIPFSLIWAGFIVVWEITAIRSGADPLFAIWGIPFIGMGLFITIGRFFFDSRRRAQTSYALTSQRIIVQTKTNTQSLTLATLSDVSISESSNGSGTITLGSSPFPMAVMAGSWPGVKGPPMFEQIPDARQVFNQVRAAQQAALSSRAG